MSLITTAGSAGAWSPDQYSFAAGDVVPQALILNTSTVSGEVDGDEPSLRVAYVDDAESAAYYAEGTQIAEDDPVLNEVVVQTKKLARLVNLSSEQFRQAHTAEQVSQSVARDLVRKADNSYLGDTTEPTGLLHAVGTVDGGEIDGSLDALVDLVADLEANGATPSAVVVDPATWGALLKLKVADTYNQSLLGAGTTDAQPLLLSLPVLRSRFIPANSGLVVDRTAIVSAAGPVRVAQSEHALFSSDAVQLRATWRIGWKVMRPERIGKFTVAAGA